MAEKTGIASRIWNAVLGRDETVVSDQSSAGTGTGKRYYNAAQSSRLTSDFPTTVYSADELIMNRRLPLVGRSRWLYANNDFMRRYVHLIKTNVVGDTGFRLRSLAVNARGDLDADLNKAAQDAYSDWCQKHHMDADGLYDMRTLEGMFWNQLTVDGEFLLRLLPGSGDYGFQIELLDTMQLDQTMIRRDLPGGGRIVFGIEYNEEGRRVAYHLRTDYGLNTYMFAGRRYLRVPAEEIIHVFLPEWAKQKRGIPQAATAMQRLNMLGGYEETALVAARVGAANQGIWVKKEEASSGLGIKGAASALSTEINTDADGNEEFVQDAEPGTFGFAPAGYDLKNFDPDYPHQQFADFVKEMKKGAAAGLNISAPVFMNDYTEVNFSSLRQATIDDREYYKILQVFYIHNVARPLYAKWARMALMTQMIKINGSPVPKDRYQKLLNYKFQAHRWPWVDPQKDATARKTAEEMQWIPKSDNILDMGGDPEQVAAQVKKDQQTFSTQQNG